MQILTKLKNPHFLTLSAITALGGFLRLFDLTKNGLWYDETFSGLMIRNPFNQIIEKGIYDVHPPFYYFLLKWWTMLVGDSELTLRLFSALCGIFLIIAIYFLVKNLFNSRAALISSFLIAISPFFIQYSQEVRMYSLGVLLTVISTIYLLKALQAKQKTLYFWIGYVAFTVLGIYTHYFIIFSVIAQIAGVLIGLTVLSKKLKQAVLKKWWQLGLALVSIAVLYLPWLPVLLRQLKEVKGDFWVPSLSIIGVIRSFFVITIGSIELENIAVLATPLLILIIIIVLLFRKIRAAKTKQSLFFTLSYLFVPFALGIIISINRSLFLDRYFIFAGIGVFIIFALAINLIKNNKVLIGITSILTVLSIIAVTTNGFGLIKNVDRMRELNQELTTQIQPGQKVIHTSSFTFIPFKYYNKDAKSVICCPKTVTTHYEGGALIEDQYSILDLASYLKGEQGFWLVDTEAFGDPPLPQISKKFVLKESYQFDQDILIYYERKK